MNIQVPAFIYEIASAIDSNEGKAILVGGAVRDSFLNLPLKDIDIEVYGIKDYDTLKGILSPFGTVIEVGKSFGVLKLSYNDYELDISFPRTETKTHEGHKGFDVLPDPTLPFEKASLRRDFTINSMGYDLIDKKLIDPHQGLQDLNRKTLRHVSPAFSEDPLRVLRAMQFAARFELTIAEETISLCYSLKETLSELPKERLFDEFRKLFLKAKKPSIGLNYAIELGILSLFPECEAMIDTPQDPDWHPEGDVWVHTLLVVDEMAKLRPKDPKQALILMFAALCHDFGKPDTTVFIDGHWRSRGHEVAGDGPTRSFLAKLTDEKDLIEPVVALVREHLKPALLYKANLDNPVTDGAIRRLSLRVSLKELLILGRADHFGCLTEEGKARKYPPGDWLEERTRSLNLHHSKPTPILKGRHLMEFGVKPGIEMGEKLKLAFEAQLDGLFDSVEGAIMWYKDQNSKS